MNNIPNFVLFVSFVVSTNFLTEPNNLPSGK